VDQVEVAAKWQRRCRAERDKRPSLPHGRCVGNAPSLTMDRLGRCDETVIRTPRGRHCCSARGGDKIRTGGLCRRRGHTARRSGRPADVGRPAAMGVVPAPPVVAAADVGRIGKLTAPALGSFGAPPPGAMVEGSEQMLLHARPPLSKRGQAGACPDASAVG
jgi:hypothetical protein